MNRGWGTMLIAEKLALVAFEPETGHPDQLTNTNYSGAGIAVLLTAELALRGAVAVVGSSITVAEQRVVDPLLRNGDRRAHDSDSAPQRQLGREQHRDPGPAVIGVGQLVGMARLGLEGDQCQLLGDQHRAPSPIHPVLGTSIAEAPSGPHGGPECPDRSGSYAHNKQDGVGPSRPVGLAVHRVRDSPWRIPLPHREGRGSVGMLRLMQYRSLLPVPVRPDRAHPHMTRRGHQQVGVPPDDVAVREPQRPALRFAHPAGRICSSAAALASRSALPRIASRAADTCAAAAAIRAPRSARSGLTFEPNPIPTQRGAVVSWR